MHSKTSLDFFLSLSKAATIMTRTFDTRLGGLSFSDFLILRQLSQAEGEKLRRVDLAERVGLTPSGITRLLAPMEKIGLVKSGESERDARVRYVLLAPSGRRRLQEETERAELAAEELLPSISATQLKSCIELLDTLGRNRSS